MPEKPIVPHGDNLRNALRWLAEQSLYESPAQKTYTRDQIEQASLRFDLTPMEEDFLMRKFLIPEDLSPDEEQH
ncbi:MAG: hypothetical protein AMJ53_08615 [Gammaproteobacteria bacterium SG8_11]|nr:MAG: hypothetical protein AMJ53_08615 [Gammaproteobacteria bacterium SG8_11]